MKFGEIQREAEVSELVEANTWTAGFGRWKCFFPELKTSKTIIWKKCLKTKQSIFETNFTF